MEEIKVSFGFVNPEFFERPHKYSDSPEIDACHLTITHAIERYIDEDQKRLSKVLDWLRKSFDNLFDENDKFCGPEWVKDTIWSYDLKGILFWIRHCPKIIRMLKIRIYNALINPRDGEWHIRATGN